MRHRPFAYEASKVKVIDKGVQCAFCGRYQYPNGQEDARNGTADRWLYDPVDNGKLWCGCDEGREAGVYDRYQERYDKGHAAWVEKTEVYVAERPCPKCGNPLRETTHRPGNGVLPVSPWGFHNRQALSWPYMERYCGRCGYRSDEVPLDTEAKG